MTSNVLTTISKLVFDETTDTYKIPKFETKKKVDRAVKMIKTAIMSWVCPPRSRVERGTLILGIIRHEGFEKSLGMLIAVADDERFKRLLVANRVDECIPQIAHYFTSVKTAGSMFDTWNLHLVKALVDEATAKITAVTAEVSA